MWDPDAREDGGTKVCTQDSVNGLLIWTTAEQLSRTLRVLPGSGCEQAATNDGANPADKAGYLGHLIRHDLQTALPYLALLLV